MKKTVKYLPLIAALALASCAKDAPSKSEVEAGFSKFEGTMPEVTISSVVGEIDALAGYATVEVTYSGLSQDGLSNLSVGVLSDTDPTFLNASFTKVESPADGAVSVKAKVSANKICYIKGVVAFDGGTSYSDVLEVKTPDVPLYAKVDGYKFTCPAITSGAYGDEYENISILVELEGDSTEECRIWGMEVYYNSKGYGRTTASSFGSAVGVIDNEKGTITIPAFSYLNMQNGAAYYFITGLDAPTFGEMSSYSEDIVMTWDESTGSLNIKNGWVTVVRDKSTGESSFDDAYNGGISFVRQ